MASYIVKESSSTGFAQYKNYVRIAILKVEHGVKHVSMISERAKGVIEIIQVWEKVHKGHTTSSKYFHIMREAHELAEKLTKEDPSYPLNVLCEIDLNK